MATSTQKPKLNVLANVLAKQALAQPMYSNE